MKNGIIFLLLIVNYNLISQANQYDKPTGQKYTSTYVPIDLGLHEKALKDRQQQNQQRGKENIIKLKELYLNAENYPDKLLDGTHEVELTDNQYEVATFDVYVVDNKITHLVKNGAKGDSVPFSTEIKKGKCTIKLFLGGQDLGYFDAYFIKDIYN